MPEENVQTEQNIPENPPVVEEKPEEEPVIEEENEELDNELVNIILADDDVIGVDAIWDENEEFCIGEY